MNRIIEGLFEDLQYLEYLTHRAHYEQGLLLSQQALINELIDLKIIALTDE